MGHNAPFSPIFKETKMKPIIEKLASQAGYNARFCSEDFDLAKYTELVIQECIKTLNDDSVFMPELGGYAFDICEKFGIDFTRKPK
jgi:hypothetical protein